MSSSFDIVIDSKYSAGLARFWAAVLRGYAVRPYDEAEIKRLALLGFTPDSDPSVAVDGPGPTMWFQRVEALVAGHNRIHLDLRAKLRSDEVKRLTALGATVRDVHDQYTVMLDPEGNRFCVFDGYSCA